MANVDDQGQKLPMLAYEVAQGRETLHTVDYEAFIKS
jgi:hypothetical protein